MDYRCACGRAAHYRITAEEKPDITLACPCEEHLGLSVAMCLIDERPKVEVTKLR